MDTDEHRSLRFLDFCVFCENLCPIQFNSLIMLKLNITKEKKYILIGGGVLLLLALLYRFYPTIQDIGPKGSEIDLKKQKIARYRQKAQKRDELESRLIKLNRNLQQAEFGLLAGETPALAAVDIQNIINKITEKIDIEVNTIRVLKTVGFDNMNYLSVPVQFSFKSSIRQLKELLYEIESSPKYLSIVNMKFRNPGRTPLDKVQSTVTVSGFLKKERG